MLFSCQDIHVTLGGRKILSAISTGVDGGEILGVVGPNGAGKTTLFETLSGRQAPGQGTITFDGRDVTRLRLHERARLGIGRTFQSPVVPEALTVGEVFKVARQAFSPMLTRHHAEWAARQVRLRVGPDVLAGSLETLNRRKLLLACLLMRRPRVLLMDEPASGLISSEIDELDTIVRLLARELGIAVMLVEHRLELLSAIADRVDVLDVGQMICSGPPETVFDDPRVRAAYFDLEASH